MKKQVTKSAKSKAKFRKSSKFSIRRLYANHRNIVIIGAILLLAGGGYIGYRAFAASFATRTWTAADKELKGGRVVYGTQNITDNQSGLANKTVRAVYLGYDPADVMSLDETLSNASGHSFFDCWYIRVVANPKNLTIKAKVKISSSNNNGGGFANTDIDLNSIWPDQYGYKTVCANSSSIKPKTPNSYKHSINFFVDGVSITPQDAIIYISKLTRESKSGGNLLTYIVTPVYKNGTSAKEAIARRVTVRPRWYNSYAGYKYGIQSNMSDSNLRNEPIQIGFGYGPDSEQTSLPKGKYVYAYISPASLTGFDLVPGKDISQAKANYSYHAFASYDWQPNIDYVFEEKLLANFNGKAGSWHQFSVKNSSTGEVRIILTYKYPDRNTKLSKEPSLLTSPNYAAKYARCEDYPYSATEFKNLIDEYADGTTSKFSGFTDRLAPSLYDNTACQASRRISLVTDGIMHETGGVIFAKDKVAPTITSVSTPIIFTRDKFVNTGGTLVRADITVNAQDDYGITSIRCDLIPVGVDPIVSNSTLSTGCENYPENFPKTTSVKIGVGSRGVTDKTLPRPGNYNLEVTVFDTSGNRTTKSIPVTIP